jgi:hypothetical protein
VSFCQRGVELERFDCGAFRFRPSISWIDVTVNRAPAIGFCDTRPPWRIIRLYGDSVKKVLACFIVVKVLPQVTAAQVCVVGFGVYVTADRLRGNSLVKFFGNRSRRFVGERRCVAKASIVSSRPIDASRSLP